MCLCIWKFFQETIIRKGEINNKCRDFSSTLPIGTPWYVMAMPKDVHTNLSKNIYKFLKWPGRCFKENFLSFCLPPAHLFWTTKVNIVEPFSYPYVQNCFERLLVVWSLSLTCPCCTFLKKKWPIMTLIVQPDHVSADN